jgi:DNA polymerase-1
MWSEYSGLINKYIKQFEENIKPDNRIHPRYSVATTVTGRTSASNPSIQNFPKRSSSSKIIRSLITAPPGHVLLSFDQAQAELRWAAQVSGDKNMISAYLEGSDLHTKTAEALLGKSKSEVDPEEFKRFRRSAKVVNFGLLYGMGSHKFRDYARFEYGLDLPLDEAQRYRDVFFSTYPGLLSYHRAVERFCKKFKYIVSPLGRVRRFPEIDGDDEEIVKRAIRQAINFPIQSASSDSVLLSLVLLLRKKVLDKRFIRPIIFIHDDLTFECVDKPDIISYYVSEIKEAMENPPLEDFGIKMSLPLRSDVEIGYTLAEMKEYNE